MSHAPDPSRDALPAPWPTRTSTSAGTSLVLDFLCAGCGGGRAAPVTTTASRGTLDLRFAPGACACGLRRRRPLR